MAVTRLLRIKETKGSNKASHLRKNLFYICRNEKCGNGLWIGGNAGRTPEMIYRTMIGNKKFWGKEDGSQAFHYMLSFPPDCGIDEATAFQAADEFCRELLGDDYYYAFAVHNDKAHMHVHITFDSVSKTDGLKFHSPKGDWENRIQPITDRICKKYHLPTLEYDEERRGRNYGEWKRPKQMEKGEYYSWTDIIRDDIDEAIEYSDSYEAFLDYLRSDGYTVTRNGKFLSLLPEGAGRAFRTGRLGDGYAKEEIIQRIADKGTKPAIEIRYKTYGDRQEMREVIYAKIIRCPGWKMTPWSKKMNCWIKRGSKGIALIDKQTGARPKLRYVFDVSDTVPSRNGRQPVLWQLLPEHYDAVRDHLLETYGLEDNYSENLEAALMGVAVIQTENYLDDAVESLLTEAESSYLGADTETIRKDFRFLMAMSTLYTISRRCGLDPANFVEADDFRNIVKYRDIGLLAHLGDAVWQASEPVLIDIGRTVRKIILKESRDKVANQNRGSYNIPNKADQEPEKPKISNPVVQRPEDSKTKQMATQEPENPGTRHPIVQEPENPEITHPTVQEPEPETDHTAEQKGGNDHGTDLLPQRGLPLSEPDDHGRDSGREHREVRDAPRDISEGEQAGDVFVAPAEREAEQLSGGHREDRAGASGSPDGRAAESISGAGEERPDGVGGAPEQPERDGGRDHLSGTDLHLIEDQTEESNGTVMDEAEMEIVSALSLPVIPTMEEQIRDIEEREAALYAGEISIPEEVVDEILRTGGNKTHSLPRLIHNFMSDQTDEEYTEFVRTEYGTGGKGFEIDGKEYSVWFDPSGMQIALGHTVHDPILDKAFLSWENVSSRIHQLLKQGEYALQPVLDAARDTVIKEHAQSLAYFERDMSEGVAEHVFADMEPFTGGFPDIEEKLSVLLAQRDFLVDLNARLEGFANVYENNHDLMQFRFYNPQKILRQFQCLALPTVPYQARSGFQWQDHKMFITQDEIDAYLARGGAYSEGRLSTYSFYLQNDSIAERTNFIKEKYGTGGQSNALSGADDSWADYDGKGLRFSRKGISNPETEILLPWKKVAQRIDFLIENGRFLSAADYDHMAAYERKTMASKILSFYGGLPPEIPRPFAYQQDQVLAYGGSLEDLTEALEDRSRMQSVLKAMEEALAALPLDDFRYQERSGILADMRGYVDGSYTLFPNKNERKEPLIENRQMTLFDYMDADAFETVAEEQKVAEPAPEKTVEKRTDLVDAGGTKEKLPEGKVPEAEEPEKQASKPESTEEKITEAEPPGTSAHAPAIRDPYEYYLPLVEAAVLKDTAYQNACRNSDRENAEIEGNAAIKRAVDSLEDMELYRLYYDDSGFHNRLHREVIESTYPTLSASAPAETFNIWQLSETAAEEYNAIKERYQSTLVGFEQHGYFEFYGDDARLVSQIIRSRVFEKPTGTDTRLFTAFPVDQWSAFSEMIRKKGESLALMNERADGTHRLMKYFNWKDYLPLDALIHVDGREFRIDTVDYQTGVVSLQDMTMAKEARYPIFRNESVEFVRSYYEEEAPAYDFSTEIRVMDALEQSGVSHNDFSGEQMDVIYDAAQKELDLEPLADPDFPPEQMQLIVDAEERLRESGDGIPADLLGLLSEDVMTLEEVDAARAKYQLPQEGDEKEKKNEKTEAGANPGEASRGELTPSERFSVIDVDWHPSKKEYSIWDSRLNNYYINADGNTVVFDSRWQAEDYRNDLIENYQTKAQFPPLERAKQLLNWYSIAEFGVPADFDDPAKVGIGYTTVGEEELPIEVFVNLVDFRLERFFNNELIETRQYDSLEDLIAVELGNLDYDELVSVSDEEIEAAKAVHQIADDTENVKLRSIVLELNPDRSEEQESSEEAKQKEPESSLSEQHVSEQLASEQPEVETKPDLEQEQPKAGTKPDSESQHQERINFRITDDDLGAGGQKTKFRANMDAIHLLKNLETENRLATAEEQEILSRYVGWGGIPQAFDERAEGWSGEYQELRSALTEDEYKEARASTLNAFYTSPTVIKAMYEALERMGLCSGNILEPSCGVGNFMGLIPESMENARMYGVELDSVSGRIAQQLYQRNTISVQGFETTQYPDNFFDCVIGNVPFGSYKVADKRYDRQNFLIHDYFIAKSIDLVRPGGVIAVITSSGTMDKANSSVREYIGNRADLLGAVRLPKNAFLRNANTGVVADILFLQKRDRASIEHPSWTELGTTLEGYTVNSYFAQHPEMVLGEFTTESTQYGRQEVTVRPIEGAELSVQLHEALNHISGQITEYEPVDDELVEDTTMIPADPAVKNFSFTEKDGEVYYRENSQMRKMTFSKDMKTRVLGMVGLRDTVRELIDCQLNDGSDEEVEQLQQRLESQYDSFTAQFGLINNRTNKRAFSNDNSYSLLASLEMLDEEGNLERKADIFTRRTIRRAEPVTHVDTASDALALSIGEKAKVDLPYMAELLGTPGEYGKIIQDLQGVIFHDPAEELQEDEAAGWHTADDYLSGNVRKKLEIAKRVAAYDEKYKVNVEYLEKVQPKDLDASEIEVRLGATWVKQEYIQEFMEEMFRPPWRMRDHIRVLYSKHTGQWQIAGKSFDKYNVRTNSTYGTKRANGYRLLEDALNLRDTKIYDTIRDDEGKEKRVLNQNETTLAQQKQELLKDEFKDWIFRDMGRREDICRTYNTLFNSIRPREYDGSHIQFVGMNPEITMMEHQRNAVAHILYGNNTLLAHCVGAGKTFEMTAAAMESIRLGLARKCLFVVPNHLTQQWGSDFLRLYPGANVLVATKKDFEPANRKKFCSRIATGQYDAIIIGHSQFERIPLSVERQAASIERQIDDIMLALSDADASGMGKRSFTVKQLEKTKRSLEAKLAKLNDQSRKDDVVTFEQLGIDKLFVDESHYYKNLFLYTKMNNVAGIAQTDAQKSSDMFMKCQYMDEITGGRGVTFATGTPVSNTMSELYTIMRYLQYDTLQEMGLGNFDAWAASFGETITSIELSPEGTGYRAKTRFARFYNLPELISVFRECADVQTADMLNLPVPESEFIDEKLQPSEIQKEMVETFSKRADMVRNGRVDSSVDNMLRITTDGRKLALDQRLLNDMLPDYKNSKVNRCVDNIYGIWKETEEKRLTQLVFSDLSTPKKDGSFNVYDDLHNKLVAKGVPPEEIAFIHNADTEVKKEELFKKVRTGQVRILVGSTAKMGAGTNVQDRLIALHHLDVPWKPSDLEQREGRILRQGNQNEKVKIYRYVTEGTFDAFSWQTLETKQKFISQIMTSKSPVRSAEDVDDTALTYAEIKALATSNPYIKEKMSLDVDVSKLKLLKANYKSQFYQLESDVAKKYPGEIKATEQYIAGLKADAEAVAAIPELDKEHFSMTVNGTVYKEYKEAGEAIINAAIAMRAAGVDGVIGEYHGFSMQAGFVMLTQKFTLTLQKDGGRHYVELGKDPTGNITRINHALTSIGEKLLPEAEQKLENLRQQMQNAQEELKKPFPKEQELAEKSARLAELNALLNMDKKDSMDAVGVGEKTAPVAHVSYAGIEKNQPITAGSIPGRSESGQSPGWPQNQGNQGIQNRQSVQSSQNSQISQNAQSNLSVQNSQSNQSRQSQDQSRFRNTKQKMYAYR